MKAIYKLILLLLIAKTAASQEGPTNLVYIDTTGLLRWTKTKAEAAFFGVNYTVPFAYGYRSHKALNIDPEKAIDADVYHFSRLGLHAFRVHVWDTEITDSAGNLLNNEHLRLFDYLIKKLKERGIKILITPIAFWGNGYPEPDEPTPGFSRKYGKRNAPLLEAAILAQENYMRQFFTHVNPYTKLTYVQDPDVIAAEINNEPHHSGPKEKVTEYINRLISVVKSTGFSKPIFYNISESPTYADAVVRSNADGYSFQWYPTGLVSGATLQGNYLPHVDQYTIPFGDTIKEFAKKPRMVYEFDAGDVMHSTMYPAMARSFRSAGFQWATQFAYDPMYTAQNNTEYQTHYVNLAYTPAKAISLLIAAKAFQQLPLNVSYGTYPANTKFGDFRISYKEQLSEMNAKDEFYYSNNTATAPKNAAALMHIAGVGSSPLVKYDGTGAYFLDKVSDGIWRLEIMPDAITVGDPFAKTSPDRSVTGIKWQTHRMHIDLPNLGKTFRVTSVTKSSGKARASHIAPGVYVLVADRIKAGPDAKAIATDFFAPTQSDSLILSQNASARGTMIASPGNKVVLFDPVSNREALTLYNSDWQQNKITYQTENASQLPRWRATISGSKGRIPVALQLFVADKLKGLKNETLDFTKVVLVGKPDKGLQCKLTLITKDAQAFSHTFSSTEDSIMSVALADLKPDSFILLPRPYPSFMPFSFKSNSVSKLKIEDVERVQISLERAGIGTTLSSFEIESIYLDK